MNKFQKFQTFLESLKNKGHDKLIESIYQGFKVIYENVNVNSENQNKYDGASQKITELGIHPFFSGTLNAEAEGELLKAEYPDEPGHDGDILEIHEVLMSYHSPRLGHGFDQLKFKNTINYPVKITRSKLKAHLSDLLEKFADHIEEQQKKYIQELKHGFDAHNFEETK